MAFQYLTNVSLKKATQDYLELLLRNGMTAPSERISVSQSCDRITSEAVYAHICAPHYPACAMDGIALNARNTFGASETTPVTLERGQFAEVDTGDQLPEDCDAVIMIEDVIPNKDGSIRLYAPAAPWQHVRQIGEDVCAGEMLLASRHRITPAAIGAMLAGGVLSVSVLSRPVVGVIPTGDELVLPSENPKPGEIMEFNSAIFSSMLIGWGALPKVYPIVRDERRALCEALRAALETCDMVLLCAGSSAGREDYSTSVIDEVGAVLYHGMAIKPGKPAILGYRNEKPVIGVPGYPVSGIIVLEQVLKPIIALWNGQELPQYEYSQAKLSRAVVSGLKYQEFIRVRLGYVEDQLIASPLNRGSGVVTSFMKADGLLEVPQGVEGLEAGASVPVRLLRDERSLRHTLVVIGSHDPLLDEIGDLMHLKDPSLSMSSTHVGSLGGIMAIKRGEAHAAGIHLLNESDGVYNVSYLKRYFPDGGVHLVECVQRIQGLMVAKGNPLGIHGIIDLNRTGLRYVNRQKGSGTRVLVDYLCGRDGVHTDSINGYDREEYTHTSVAAQIAAGTADAGMGIYAAAKLYDLDFIPICMEQYDLIIPDTAWALPMIRSMLDILRDGDLRKRAEALGGYRLDHPGIERIC